jgi:mono/diheme cytochrome c family protein
MENSIQRKMRTGMIKLGLLTGYTLFFQILSVDAQHKSINNNAGKQPSVHKKVDPLSASIMRGMVVYKNECLSCHQADGSGVPKMAPSLIKAWRAMGDNSELIKLVLKGSAGKVAADGETYNNPMASHSHLTNRQIADVLTYIRKSFGNNAGAVNAAEVKAVRARLK